MKVDQDQTEIVDQSVQSMIDSIRQNTATVNQQIRDELSESGIFSRASQSEQDEMLQMSFSRFQQHMIKQLSVEMPSEEVDFELSADEVQLAEIRALRQAQAEVEAS